MVYQETMSRASGGESITAAGPRRASSFDVVCVGEALWDVTVPRFGASSSSAPLRAGGAAVNTAIALAQRGLRVGLAAAIADDTLGRALCARVAAAGVDVGGVALGPQRAGLVLVQSAGAAGRVVATEAESVLPVAVPGAWESQVLLLSGLTPAVPHAAGLCKAARAARRAGTIVVVDVNARWRLWAGRDPRASRAVMHEAHVVRCSTADLAALGIDEASARSAMREEAALVLTNGAGAARVTGPFGEIARAPREVVNLDPTGAGDAFTAAICAELARAGQYREDDVELWDRALRRGHAAALAQMQQR
jgi:sugar/nucleoside kinase (ribokinase family)